MWMYFVYTFRNISQSNIAIALWSCCGHVCWFCFDLLLFLALLAVRDDDS